MKLSDSVNVNHLLEIIKEKIYVTKKNNSILFDLIKN